MPKITTQPIDVSMLSTGQIKPKVPKLTIQRKSTLKRSNLKAHSNNRSKSLSK